MPPHRSARSIDRSHLTQDQDPEFPPHDSNVDGRIFGTGLARADRRPILTKSGDMVVGNFKLTSIGLELLNQEVSPTDADMRTLGQVLHQLQGSIQWLIGDWIVCADEIQWGDLEAFAQEIGFEYQTVRDFAYVAQNVHLSLRNDKLSFNHHRVIARLDPLAQKQYLEMALEGKWSVAKLRSIVTPTLSAVKREAAFSAIKRTLKLIGKSKYSRADVPILEQGIQQLEDLLRLTKDSLEKAKQK